ncbi:MAG: PHP domain-containing protein, partial [Ruminococcus sp.]|nr:PHP domain-containing protein [Ruminococcus sp.]
MNIALSEFLKEYCTELSESVGAGEIYKMTYTPDLRHFSFYARFEGYVQSEDIFAFENAAAAAIKVDSVRLYPRYDKSLFDMKDFTDILVLLKRDVSVVNGFLDDADIRCSDRKITIGLNHSGRDILERFRFPAKLRQLIVNMFGLDFEIELIGGGAITSEEFDTITAEVEASLPDYSDQFAPEKTAEEMRQEQLLAAVPTRSVDNDSLDMEFDGESAEILKGRPIREKPISIADAVNMLSERVVIVGDVFASESKELRSGKTVVTLSVTDYSGSLLVKMFVKNEDEDELKLLSGIKNGTALLVAGKIDYDQFAKDICIMANSVIKVKRAPKADTYPEKRVELHCHTNMSAMDAVTDPVTLINRAAEWGHQAMAITDHGNVQAFPDCMYNMPKNFKVIYGMEAYVVNDIERDMVVYGDDDRGLDEEIIVFDVETTGLSYRHDRLTEIGAVKLRNLQIIDSFNTKVNPGFHIPEKITELTGISDSDVA